MLLTESVCVIMITIWYQFIDRGIYNLQLICIFIGFIVLFYMLLLVPESPKWQYTWFYYNESIKNLKYVGKFNGLQRKQTDRIKKIKFDIEMLL